MKPVGQALQMSGQDARGAASLAAHFWNYNAIDVSCRMANLGFHAFHKIIKAATELAIG